MNNTFPSARQGFAGLALFIAAVFSAPAVMAQPAAPASQADKATSSAATSSKKMQQKWREQRAMHKEVRSIEFFTSRSLTEGKIPNVEFRPDVAYLPPDRTEKLDIYLPKNREKSVKSPAIVMIHGGGWVGGDKTAKREVQAGAAFARAGYVVVSVEYDKTPRKMWPTNLNDCKNAVRWLRKNAEELQVDPEHIGVIGGSAGGHLSLMVAFTSDVPELEPNQPYPGISDRVQACVNLYGITNLVTRQGTDKKGNPTGELKNSVLMAKSREQDLAAWKLASPVEHITSNTPPTLTFHGTADATVDRDQATELDQKMKTAGASHTLTMIPGAPHAFVLNDSKLKEDLTPQVIAFFDKYLKPAAK